jgi:hypothetical protein
MTTCFMHVPKSAGTSMHVALERALPHGAVSPRRMDPWAFCCFRDFDRLGDEARAVVAADDSELDELASYAAVSGHFGLRSLTRLSPPARIGIVLREPRARLISHYLYLRVTPGIREVWQPYDTFTPADRPFDDFLRERRVAMTSDNKTTRMLVQGDPRVRDGEFIAASDLAPLAEAAWRSLEQLGFVGALELGMDAWAGLGTLFGVDLEPVVVNTTGVEGLRPGALPVPAFDERTTLDLLERRTAADQVLYMRASAGLAGSEAAARGLARDAFAAQWDRLRSLLSAPAEMERV